mgnify:CR=1 FL=1
MIMNPGKNCLHLLEIGKSRYEKYDIALYQTSGLAERF